MNPTLTALLIPFLGTALGASFVFFMKKEMPDLLQKILLGFASGVMVAASVWSLLIPGMELGGTRSLARRALKCCDYRLCDRVRADDGAGRGYGLVFFLLAS